MRIEAALNYNRSARTKPMGIGEPAAGLRANLSRPAAGYKVAARMARCLREVGLCCVSRLHRTARSAGAYRLVGRSADTAYEERMGFMKNHYAVK